MLDLDWVWISSCSDFILDDGEIGRGLRYNTIDFITALTLVWIAI